MARVLTAYDHVLKLFVQGSVDWDADTVKLALITSGYTLDTGHTEWSQVSGSEVSSGSGYTTGGESLAGKAVSDISVDANDVTFSSITKVFRGAVLYVEKTVDGLTNPLVAHLLFDDTGGGTDISVTGNDYDIVWNANGIFTLSTV